MILKVITLPDPRLRQVSLKVEDFDKSLQSFSEDLIDTMYAKGGIGLAAVQVGVLKRVFVIDIEEETDGPMVFVNPIVKGYGEVLSDEEGCLSIPKVRGDVLRPSLVDIEYQDVFGEPKKLSASALFARCILHEFDHLEGRLFIEYAKTDEEKAFYNLQLIERGMPPFFT